jgi:O-antigen ligase
VILGVVLIAAAAAGLALLELVIRRTDVGAALTLLLMFVLELELWDLSIDLSGVRIGPSDLLVVVLLTAAVARLLRIDRLTPAQRLLLLFGVLVVWAIVRGAAAFGIPPTVNEARKFLVFLASALYFSTAEVRPQLLDRIIRMWIALAVGLCALTLFRWTLDVSALTGGSNEGGGSLRVIPAAGALFIAQAALLAFPMVADRSRPLLRWLAPVLLAFVVLLQHRTVWVIAAVGVLYLLFRERALAGRALTVLAVAVALLAGLVFTVFAEHDDDIGDQLSQSAQSTATFEWRVDGWMALVAEGGPEGVDEVLTGQPFGGGWERTMANGNVVDVSPHSFYVEPYLRVGAVGLGALLLLYAVALRRTAAKPSGGDDGAGHPRLVNANVLHTVIAVQLLFFITYTPDAVQALLLGLGLAVPAAQYGVTTVERLSDEVAA